MVLPSGGEMVSQHIKITQSLVGTTCGNRICTQHPGGWAPQTSPTEWVASPCEQLPLGSCETHLEPLQDWTVWQLTTYEEVICSQDRWHWCPAHNLLALLLESAWHAATSTSESLPRGFLLVGVCLGQIRCVVELVWGAAMHQWWRGIGGSIPQLLHLSVGRFWGFQWPEPSCLQP